jgi:TolB-like protein
MIRRALLLLAAVVLMASGCAGTSSSARMSRAREDIARDPRDGRAHGRLGILCYKAADLECARQALGEADRLDCLDGGGLYALGSTYEALGFPDSALAVYSRYPEAGFFSRDRRLMVRRVRDLVRQTVTIEDTLGREAAIPPETVALLPFQVNSSVPQFEPLGVGFAEWLMTDLHQVRSLRLLERIRTQALVDELQRQGIDVASAPRLGGLLGARRIVGGSVLVLDEERIRVDLFARDALASAGDVAVSQEGHVNDFFLIEKRLAFDLLSALRIELTPRERELIERVPTKSLAEFLAYAEAMELEAEGKYQNADDLLFNPLADAERETLDDTIDIIGGDHWITDVSDSRPDLRRRSIPLPPAPPPGPPGGSPRGGAR